MSIFTEIREHVTARDAAEYYGIHVNRHGMARCPFHNDRHPSMKIDERYHCFSCGADGDVINFVSHYFGIPPIEAARKIADDFCLPLPPDPAGSSALDQKKLYEIIREKRKNALLVEKFSRTERIFYGTLCEYARLLGRWKEKFSPSSPDKEPDSRFVTAVRDLPVIDYLIDGLFSGPLEDRISIIHSWGGKIIEFRKAVIRDQQCSEICA